MFYSFLAIGKLFTLEILRLPNVEIYVKKTAGHLYSAEINCCMYPGGTFRGLAQWPPSVELHVNLPVLFNTHEVYKPLLSLLNTFS